MVLRPPAGQVSDLLKNLRNIAGLSQREVAEALGMSQNGYTHYENPKRFKRPYIPYDLAEKLAALFGPRGVDPADVFALAGAEEAARDLDKKLQTEQAAQQPRQQSSTGFQPIPLPDPASFPLDIPVYVLDALDMPELMSEGTQTMEFFGMREDSVDLCRRPPGLANVKDAYGAYSPSDALHRFPKGELLMVHPSRPVLVGDFVLVYYQVPGDRQRVYIGRLVAETRDKLTIEIDNPRMRDEFAKSVAKAHKILTVREIWGL